MLVTTNPQQTLWETMLPPGYAILPAELASPVDALLDDPVFFALPDALLPLLGRPSIPIESSLRMVLLEHRYRLGTRACAGRPRTRSAGPGSAGSRRMSGCRTLHLGKITGRCGADVIGALNTALLAKAGAARLVMTDQVRADTTVVR